MRAVALKNSTGVSEKFASKQLTIKQTWASYTKARWPLHTIYEAQKEWGLNAYEARSVVDGNVSLATIQQIYKREGLRAPLLALDILLVQCGIDCTELADQLDKEADNARRREEARIKPLNYIARRLAADRGPVHAPEVGNDDGLSR